MSKKQKADRMGTDSQFIGRTELLDWLNKTLGLHYKKVEDASNGAAFCQIVDMVHPGTVPLARLNFNALLPHECMENLKILQEVFTKNGITAIVDVESLSKGRYVAALNVLQFLYQYVRSMQSNTDKLEYDPVARRHSYHLPEHPAQPGKQQSENKGNNFVIAELQKKIINLSRINKSLKEDYEMMTQERDFYYDKLRKVEDFCEDNENETTYKKILDILYETDEAHGFVAPDDAQSVDESNEQDDFEQEAELPDIFKS